VSVWVTGPVSVWVTGPVSVWVTGPVSVWVTGPVFCFYATRCQHPWAQPWGWTFLSWHWHHVFRSL